jgi:signal peptidase I
MSARLNRRRLALAMGGVLAGAVAWLLFAPTPLGGQLSYVVVHGGSMAPGLADGDLAVVRRADAYEPGDAVAYESTELERVVLHRVVRSEQGRLALKGDANNWVDPGRPTDDDVLGRLWFSVPAVGTAVEWLGEPLHAAVLCGLLVLACVGGTGATVGRRRRRRQAQDDIPTVAAASRPGPGLQDGEARVPLGAELTHAGLLVAGFGAVVFVALGIVAFSRPTTHETTSELGYAQRGEFTYSGLAPAGAVYPQGRVTTGQPIYLRLVDTLQVAFSYELGTEQATGLSGGARLVAELSDGSGWRREMTLASARAFTGSTVRLSGPLDLVELRALIARVEAATGVPKPAYTLTVRPEVTVAGQIDGSALTESFSPRLPFRLDGSQLQLEGVTTNGAATPTLRPDKVGTIDVPAQAVSTLGIGGLRLDVTTARRVVIVGGALALTGLLLLGGLGLTRPRRTETGRIKALYGHMLIPLAVAPRGVAPTIEVATIGGLARMAKNAGRPLLDFDDGHGGHTYYVDDGTALYVYESSAPLPESPPSEEEIPRERLAVVRGVTERA